MFLSDLRHHPYTILHTVTWEIRATQLNVIEIYIWIRRQLSHRNIGIQNIYRYNFWYFYNDCNSPDTHQWLCIKNSIFLRHLIFYDWCNGWETREIPLKINVITIERFYCFCKQRQKLHFTLQKDLFLQLKKLPSITGKFGLTASSYKNIICGFEINILILRDYFCLLHLDKHIFSVSKLLNFVVMSFKLIWFSFYFL